MLEVKEVESYTYLRLKTQNGEVWAAITKPRSRPAMKSARQGPVMTISIAVAEKTFPTIYFGSLSGAGGGSGPASGSPRSGRGGAPPTFA